MKIDRDFLRSRVARRLFFLFLLCALVPIGLLGALSLRQVGAQLREQREERLEELSRAHAMTVFERINLLHAQLLRSVELGTIDPRRLPAALSTPTLGSPTSVQIDDQRLSWPLPPDVELVLDRREPVLVTSVDDAGRAWLLIGVRRESEIEKAVVWAVVDSPYLWWGPAREKTLALSQELHVFGADFAPLYGTTEDKVVFPEELRPTGATNRAPNRGVFEWGPDDDRYVAGMSRLPPHYGGLAIVVSEPLAELLAPLGTFKVQFLLVLLTALLAVLLASLSQIRRSLDPLEKLQQGTRRIARRDFEHPVEIDSGDEFEELAQSFNSMSSTLARQFAALTTMNEIGQSVLSKLASESVVASALERVGEVIPVQAAALTLFDDEEPGTRARTWFRLLGLRGRTVEIEEPAGGELDRLRGVRRWLVIERRTGLPRWLAPFESIESVVHLLPIRIEDRLHAALALGHGWNEPLTGEDLDRARQLADQIAVALSNARLVGDLEQLSYGTLVALARAVDTKSPWTRGHSERVATGGRLLGRMMGMSEEEQDLLYRGGMLHDIGKIGVPSAILDKPGKLTDEETRLMRSHVEKGARILEPIPGFDEVLPIVWEHHERYDGRGYPKGLRTDEISLHGRIFAVADVFDAIRSPRPYRGAVDFEHVVSMIRLGAGTEFDPLVVEAFLEVAEEIDRHCWGGELAASVS